MTLTLTPEGITIAGTVFGLLLSGNIYFVKRLVDKLELITGLSNGVSQLGEQVAEIKADVKQLKRLEIEVAVLRTQLNPAGIEA